VEQKRRILPPVWWLLAMLLAIALHYAMPIRQLLSAPWSYSGAVLIVLGIALSAAGSGAFKRAGTPVVPFERSTALVTDGLYRFTRNPMYLGLVLSLVGVSILLGSVGAFLAIPVFVWILQTQFIAGEERFLEEIFGARYLDYKTRVRRWL
jgi:protein-S-isoprenylcysteine O-methyltransferase Ste14